MIRKLLAVTTVAVALVLATPAAASARPNVPTPTVPAPHQRPAPVAPPLCVSTTWRAIHTGRPKTRPGQVCRFTRGMWLPSSWVVVGRWSAGSWLVRAR